MWSEDAFLMSSDHPLSRRYSFDAPLPAQVLDVKVAQRAREGESSAVMAHALPLLAGRALLIGWYGAMAQALSGDEDRVFKLLDAASSVPIRLRLAPNKDACRLASSLSSESMFVSSAASGADSFWKLAEKAAALSGVVRGMATNMSIPKIDS